jgi:hypothetical protein
LSSAMRCAGLPATVPTARHFRRCARLRSKEVHRVAGALFVRLRQATATARLPWLHARRTVPAALEGVQPMFTNVTEAPMVDFAASFRSRTS